jgi:hypothetical protein
MESRHILEEMRPFVHYYKCLGEPIGWMPRLWNDGAAARSMFPTNRYFYEKSAICKFCRGPQPFFRADTYMFYVTHGGQFWARSRQYWAPIVLSLPKGMIVSNVN